MRGMCDFTVWLRLASIRNLGGNKAKSSPYKTGITFDSWIFFMQLYFFLVKFKSNIIKYID